jgi:hypothetical protein
LVGPLKITAPSRFFFFFFFQKRRKKKKQREPEQASGTQPQKQWISPTSPWKSGNVRRLTPLFYHPPLEKEKRNPNTTKHPSEMGTFTRNVDFFGPPHKQKPPQKARKGTPRSVVLHHALFFATDWGFTYERKGSLRREGKQKRIRRSP